MQPWHKQLLVLAAAGAIALSAAPAVQADDWGTIKGQVVWSGKEAPNRAPLKVDKDQAACLKNGKLLDDKLVVNPKNKGVRWCLVYLMNEKGFDKDIPIHPKLKAIKNKVVEIDQPCCQFEPHLLALREGQTLLVKNSMTISHNVNYSGGPKGPSFNQILPAGGSFKVPDLKARYMPSLVKCNIHGWMSGFVAVLKNPYFAVTDKDGLFEIKDAPAGDFRLVIWQEESGWVVGDDKPSKKGKKITIKAGDTTDLGKIPMKRAD